MSSINGLNGSLPVNRILGNKPVYKPADVQVPTSTRGADSVELGSIQNLMNQLKANDVRVDKVAAIKAQIQAGTYETDDKLNAAADKLLDDVL
jgi:anti-sigma28 factor (negative regulator of flagellin synthesis)